jgi:glyoxylase-like metal-dependent hydrolase (beta-lactamase superfamily II)
VELIPITERLSLVTGLNRGRFPSSHAFLVRDDVIALIDSGCGIRTLQQIRENYPVDMVINSHCHPDHSAGNWIFPDASLYAPVQGAESHGRLGPLSHRLIGSGPVADWWREFIVRETDFQDRAPTDFFGDNHLFDFGRLKLQAVHTPGHTSDHYCLYEPDRQILLSFDIDMTPFGPWYANPESSLTEFRRSMSRIRDLKPRLVASSHWDLLDGDIDEAFDAYEGVLDSRQEILLGLLDRGATWEELVEAAPIYSGSTYEPLLLRKFEARMIDLHLTEMADRNLIRREGDRYLPAHAGF